MSWEKQQLHSNNNKTRKQWKKNGKKLLSKRSKQRRRRRRTKKKINENQFHFVYDIIIFLLLLCWPRIFIECWWSHKWGKKTQTHLTNLPMNEQINVYCRYIGSIEKSCQLFFIIIFQLNFRFFFSCWDRKMNICMWKYFIKHSIYIELNLDVMKLI